MNHLHDTTARLRRLDLNLLVIFDALITERSVSNAAIRLALTQSAVSHALRRLRHTFADDLFIRVGGGLMPTARAIEVAEPIRQALNQIEQTVTCKPVFLPEKEERCFNLRITDYVSSWLLGLLCPVLRRRSPGISLNVVPFSGRERDDDVVGDEIHIRFAAPHGIGHPLSSRRLIREQFVVVMSKNRAKSARPLSVDRYASLPHVKVAGTIGTNMIDDALARRGLKRNIVFHVPSWNDAYRIVQQSDLIMTIPSQLASDHRFGKNRNIVMLPCPLDEIAFEIDLVWHSRYDADPGHAWLRDLITEQFAEPAPSRSRMLRAR